MNKTFADKIVAGEVTLDAFEDYIEEWHTSNSELPVAQYLGLTESQYRDIAMQNRSPEQIEAEIKTNHMTFFE